MGRIGIAVVALLAGAQMAAAVPFWGAKDSRPPGTTPDQLKPGEFVWEADESPRGPMTVVVSLDEQRAYVYRNGVRIGVASASTGKPGHETPTGVFTVLQKEPSTPARRWS